MIQVYEPKGRVFQTAKNPPARGWTHVSNPSSGELALLVDQTGVPDALLRHALDINEVARVDKDERGPRLVMLRVPFAEGHEDERRYRSTSLAIILLDDHVITLGREDSDAVDALLELEDLAIDKPVRFVFQLANSVAESFLRHLHQIDEVVDRLEEELKASQENKEVLALVHLQKSLVHFTTALASNAIMLEHVHDDPRLEVPSDDVPFLDDARVEMRQASEMAKISSELLSSTMDAFASIISNNLNIVLKAMAAMTIILSLPMIVSSIYGMNIPLPGAKSPYAFAVIMAFTVIISGVVALCFRRIKWL